MCSGCSGDYYSDFGDHEGIPNGSRGEAPGNANDQDDGIESRYGNWTEELQRPSDFAATAAPRRNVFGHEASEEYEIFVSGTQITEIRVLLADRSVGSVGGDGKNVEAAWGEVARVRERLRAVTAKRYGTSARARVLLSREGNALRVELALFCFGLFVAALVKIWALVR